MASSNHQILAKLQQLENMGLIDFHLQHIYSLQNPNDGQFFESLLPTFITDTNTVITKMESLLNVDEVDFKNDLYEACIKLKGSAGCLGAVRVSNACANLDMAIETCSKDWCIRAVNEVKREYDAVKSHLGDLLQLERDMISNANNMLLSRHRLGRDA